jgi:hypothetical protein
MVQALGNACPQGHNVLFLQLQDGPQIHFGRVNQISHGSILLLLSEILGKTLSSTLA